MIRHALYATLVGLISLSASAQDAAHPELLGGQQQPSAAPAGKAQAVGQPSAGPAAAESGSDQKPTVEQGSAPQAAKPDPQAPTSAAAEPKPEKQRQTEVPATTAAEPKPKKQAAVKPRAKQPKHAAQRGRNGPVYYGGYRDPRSSYRWAWSPWYGFYRYRPRHYAYYSYYPRYRY
ncbi:MAG: hypothetical protein M3145_10885 [Pseudomonadota bacterium]|nr:hypothetical protein [Pseudomonadota bacterium]